MQAWNAEMQRIAIADTLANHGGLTPAAPGCVFASRWAMFDSRGTVSDSPDHGGLTPAALGCVFASRWTMFDSRRAAFGSPNHGGLTPAAPGCVFASRRTMFDYRNTSSDQVLRNSPLHQNWGT
jgi:hypothetical protein